MPIPVASRVNILFGQLFLPPGHSVRKNYKIVHEMQKHPTFGADLLQEARSTLGGLKVTQRKTSLEDPISGTVISNNSASDFLI
jgi:hypothetical protein